MPVVANGDICTEDDVIRVHEFTGVDGEHSNTPIMWMVTINVHVFPRCDGSSWYSGQPCHVCWVHCHPITVCAGLGGYCHGNGGHLHPVPPPPHSHVGQDHRQDSEAGVQHPHQHPSCAGIPLRTLQHHLTSGQSS